MNQGVGWPQCKLFFFHQILDLQIAVKLIETKIFLVYSCTNFFKTWGFGGCTNFDDELASNLVMSVHMGVSENSGTPKTPQNGPFLAGKLMVVGYHHLWKHPLLYIHHLVILFAAKFFVAAAAEFYHVPSP